MGTPRNLSGDTTMAYLLNKQKGESEKAIEAVAKRVDDLSEDVVENAAAIARSVHDVMDVTMVFTAPSTWTDVTIVFDVPGITERHKIIPNGFARVALGGMFTKPLVFETSEGRITATANFGTTGSTVVQAVFGIVEDEASV